MTVPSSPALASISPSGEKRTQLTTPECLDRVARYSTLGGCGAGEGKPAAVALAIAFGEGMLGLTSQICARGRRNDGIEYRHAVL